MKYNTKKGFPQEGDVVLGTVKEISRHLVIVKLDEYENNLTGMLYPHEVSPGRIRNLRDFVKVGKKIVCLVLESAKDTQRVGLSLRRVPEKLRKEKLNQVKQEQIIEKIIENLAIKLNKEPKKLYQQINKSMNKDFLTIHSFFQSYIDGEIKISDYINDKEISSNLEEEVGNRLTQSFVEVKAIFKYSTPISSGLDKIKKVLLGVIKKTKADIFYLGGGKYEFRILDKNYKDAELRFDIALDILNKELEPIAEKFSITRERH